MHMNLARAIAILVLAAVVGLVGYQIGITQNIAAQLPAASGAPVVPVGYYGYPFHWGFGFGFGIFGFLFWILAIFLFFGLLRAAFGGGRGWGHRYGYGPMRGPWSDEARARMEELHKELHGEKPSAPRGGTSSTP
jgi:hypothetical protein